LQGTTTGPTKKLTIVRIQDKKTPNEKKVADIVKSKAAHGTAYDGFSKSRPPQQTHQLGISWHRESSDSIPESAFLRFTDMKTESEKERSWAR